MKSVLVIGSGLAGLSAARAARAAGFAGPLTVLGQERHRPYDRPPLSKDYLAGALPRTELALEHQTEDLQVEWLLGVQAVGLDATTRTVRLADGRDLRPDGIVLATGSAAVLPPGLLGGNEVARPANLGVLRTVEDGDWLRGELQPGRRLVVIGAGLIGSEVAATATALGCQVSVLDREAAPLDRLYGPEMALHLSAVHRRHGVDLLHEAAISELEIAAGRVRSIGLADGRVLPADVVLVATGARPDLQWLAAAGVEVGDGVVCDGSGRTSVSGVVAVGDCAAWFDPHLERPHRTQHWTDALERPAVAMAALLGLEPPRRKPYLPYFWSDQYDLRIQMAGYASLADRVHVEQGDPTSGPFLAVYYRGSDPVAVLGVSQPREFTRWRKNIATALAQITVETRPSEMAAPAAAGPTPYVAPAR